MYSWPIQIPNPYKSPKETNIRSSDPLSCYVYTCSCFTHCLQNPNGVDLIFLLHIVVWVIRGLIGIIGLLVFVTSLVIMITIFLFFIFLFFCISWKRKVFLVLLNEFLSYLIKGVAGMLWMWIAEAKICSYAQKIAACKNEKSCKWGTKTILCLLFFFSQ